MDFTGFINYMIDTNEKIHKALLPVIVAEYEFMEDLIKEDLENAENIYEYREVLVDYWDIAEEEVYNRTFYSLVNALPYGDEEHPSWEDEIEEIKNPGIHIYNEEFINGDDHPIELVILWFNETFETNITFEEIKPIMDEMRSGRAF